MNHHIRQAKRSDLPAIGRLIRQAFDDEGPSIAALVEEMVDDPTAQPLRSIVAVMADRVIGHILFTAARIEGRDPTLRSAILAPLTVHPDHQRQGIGGRLIQQGLCELREQGVVLVFVLGHPAYYARHGFTAAGVHGLAAPHPIPAEHAEAWMVRAMRPELLGTVTGTVCCANALSDRKYWVE